MFWADAAGDDFAVDKDEGFPLVVTGLVLNDEGRFGITGLRGIAAFPLDLGSRLGEVADQAERLAVGEWEVGGELVERD